MKTLSQYVADRSEKEKILRDKAKKRNAAFVNTIEKMDIALYDGDKNRDYREGYRKEIRSSPFQSAYSSRLKINVRSLVSYAGK